MKSRKLSKTLLAAVLMLSLLMSVFPGFGIVSSADTTTWDHSYAVTQNDLSSVTAETSPWADFVLYKWAHTGNSDGYKDSVLGNNVEIAGGALKDNADQLRTSANGNITINGGTGSTNDNGYLNFALDNLKTWALFNTKEAAKVDTDFEMEVTMEGTSRVGYRNVIITPEIGKLNVETANATGLAIALTDDATKGVRVYIAGAIDTTTLAYDSVSVTSTTSQNFGINKSVANWVSAKLGGNNTTNGFGTTKNKTFRIQVKDGVVTVKDTAGDYYMSVALSANFNGGYVAYAGTNAYFSATSVDDGMALASIKWKDILSTEEEFQAKTEFDYDITQNTGTTNLNLNPTFVSDFKVYRWEFPVASGVVNGAPTLRPAFADGLPISTAVASNRNDQTTSSGFDGGYYSFVRYSADNDTKADGGKYGDLEWSTSASRTSNFLDSFTHGRVLGADEDFYLEMSMLADASGDANTQAIMIAPKGEFAVTQDGVAEKGVFIGVNAQNNWTTIAGAIDGSNFSDDDLNLMVHSANNTNKTSGNWHRIARTADVAIASQVVLGGAIPTDLTFYGNASNTVTAHQGGVVTFCVLVEDGVMSVWNKADSTVMMKVTLADSYEGGAVSYVGSNFNRGAFAGMYLTTDKTKFPAEAAGTYVYNTTSQDQTGDAAADEAFQAYLNANYDLYVDGVKADDVCGSDAGWTADYISGSLMGNYLELKPLTDADKASIGALVPKMASKGGNTATLYASDLEVETTLRLLRTDSGDAAGNLPMIGLRMATAGDFTSDGVYVKYVRDNSNGKVVLVEVKDGVETAETELASTALHNTATVFPKLYVKLVGTALTGYVQYNYEKIDFSATVSYDEVGYVALGATTGRVMTDLLKVNLLEYADATTVDGIEVQRVDTDKAGEYKFKLTVAPEAGKALKIGSFLVNADGNTIVPVRDGFQDLENANGTEYTIYSKGDVTIEAEFYAPTENEPNIANYAMQINDTPAGEAGYQNGGLRFVFRADIQKNDEDGKYYMTIGGTPKAVKDFGILVATADTAGNLEGGLTYANKDAAYVKYTSVPTSGIYYDVCDAYADFSVQVTNIWEFGAEDTALSTRAYVLFEDDTYVQSEVATASYSDYAE